MKILYKCLKNRWFLNKEKIEAYYIELNENELTNEIKLLLTEEEDQIEEQLNRFGKIYIIIDENLKYSMCVPSGYGPHWPISGHWDMSDMFRFMYGIEIKDLKTLKNVKKVMLENSINYLKNEDGMFGNIHKLNLGYYGPEMFKSCIAESIVYNYLLKNDIKINIPEETEDYSLIANNDKIIIKTKGKKVENEYKWFGDNSCWRIGPEIYQESWDYLYYVEINWNEKEYEYLGIYKISNNNFYKNKTLIEEIKNTKGGWFAPVEFDDYNEWINKYKLGNIVF